MVEGRSEPQDPEVVSCDDKCELGQWIYGSGRQCGSAPAYDSLREKHAEFHQCAGGILRHVIVGEREQANRSLVERFGPLSEATIEEIRRLEHQCQHTHVAQGPALP